MARFSQLGIAAINFGECHVARSRHGYTFAACAVLYWRFKRAGWL